MAHDKWFTLERQAVWEYPAAPRREPGPFRLAMRAFGWLAMWLFFAFLWFGAPAGSGDGPQFAQPTGWKAFLAAQSYAMRQVASPSLREMPMPGQIQVQTLGGGWYDVAAWVAGDNRLGYRIRQAYRARVYRPANAQCGADWQVVSLRWE